MNSKGPEAAKLIVGNVRLARPKSLHVMYSRDGIVSSHSSPAFTMFVVPQPSGASFIRRLVRILFFIWL